MYTYLSWTSHRFIKVIFCAGNIAVRLRDGVAHERGQAREKDVGDDTNGPHVGRERDGVVVHDLWRHKLRSTAHDLKRVGKNQLFNRPELYHWWYKDELEKHLLLWLRLLWLVWRVRNRLSWQLRSPSDSTQCSPAWDPNEWPPCCGGTGHRSKSAGGTPLLRPPSSRNPPLRRAQRAHLLRNRNNQN